MIKDSIKTRIEKGERIGESEAVRLFHSLDLIALGKLAQSARYIRKPEKVASYVLYRNINYTNVCISMCSFCAFSRNVKDADAYILSKEEIMDKIQQAMEKGTEAILLQGGLHPECDVDFFIDLLKSMRKEFPGLYIHAFSPPEILHMAKVSRYEVGSVIEKLKQAGLCSIPGGGAEILVDDIRKEVSPNKCTASEWLMVMKKAHELGVKSSATMMFGANEQYSDRVMHLSSLRALQDETGGFTSFIPWTYQPLEAGSLEKNACRNLTKLEHNKAVLKETSAVDYLKTVAIARIFLDNFIHIEASMVTQGPKIAQLALAFGADDIGSIMIEENVVRAAGSSYVATEDELIHLIKEAGFLPAKRNVLYSDYKILR